MGCHEFADCHNQDGDYNCTCIDGYEGDGFDCEDVDECVEGLHDCDDNAECGNEAGGYNCTCDDGFFGDGFLCGDMDECRDEETAAMVANVTDHGWDTHECSQHASCINTFG